jgi:pSer/pThr/pTyr-binding forkhead associated (FHA) protein
MIGIKWLHRARRTGVAKMDARLRIFGDPSAGQIIPIPPGKLIIGREEDCHLRPASGFVSRHHCVLLLDAYTLRIRDLGSQNGTFVNGRRIGKGEIILLQGDMVSVGDLNFQIDLTPTTNETSPAVPEAQPSASPQALEGTGVFDGDTMQAEGPSVLSLPSAPPAPTPIDPSVLPMSTDNVRRTL